VSPSLETVREVVRACGLDLTFFMSKFDDSNVTIIDHHLQMTPAERFTDLVARVRFHDRRTRRTTATLTNFVPYRPDEILDVLERHKVL